MSMPTDHRCRVQENHGERRRYIQRRSIVLALATIMVLPVCHGKGATGVDDSRMLNAANEPENWLVNGGDYAGRHWSGLNQINQKSVAQLGPAWSFDFDTNRGQVAEPIVVDGVMYVTSAWDKVFALDAATGRQLWRYDPEVPGEEGIRACCDVVNRGASVYDGKVYFGTIDARLIALDAKTGKLAWSVQTGEKGRSYSITGAPRIVHGKVIIGNGGADLDARGYVTAYDAKTGRKIWRFYTVPGAAGERDNAASDDVLERLARPTWFGDTWRKTAAGGTAWNAISYDPELNQLYIGTGNGTPWNHQLRSQGKGDNLFLCSIIALDPDTGRYIWHYQENPGEAWDYDSTPPMILATLNIGGADRKVILHAPKNGFFYVIDRSNGKLLSADPFIPGITWATGIDLATGRPTEVAGARYVDAPFVINPSPAGAHNWHPMALSPQTGLVYFGTIQMGMTFRGAKSFTMETRGPLSTGVEDVSQPRDPQLAPIATPYNLIAWDPVRQRQMWSAPGSFSGVLATAGELVFQGGGATIGYLSALRATDGAQLWTHHLPNGVLAAPISYSVNGVQYIAVTAGAGSLWLLFAPREYASEVGRVFAFKVGGTAKLPDDPGPPPSLNPSTQTWSAARLQQGGALYLHYCSRCHGFPALASNVLPDLRRSRALQVPEAWKSIVIDGALSPRGMISWGKFMSPDEAEAIRAFVDNEAQQAAHGNSNQDASKPLSVPQ